MNQRTDAPEDRSNGNLVSMAHKAAMYGAWQNETLARKTLYWLLADRIDRQEGDLATIQANIHLGSIPAPVSETGDRNAVLEEAKMVCIGILGQQHTGCSQATVAQACVDAIDSLKTSAATAAQDAASQAAMHQVLPLPPQPDAITTTTPVETDHKGRPITYWGGLDKPAGAAPSARAPRIVLHENCEKHRGLSWEGIVPVAVAPITKICPLCVAADGTAKLICPRCGADRYKEDCREKANPTKCPMHGDARGPEAL